MIPYVRQLRAVARWKPFDTSTPEGRSDERYRRIVLTTASSMAVRLAGAVAGLVVVPLLLSYLGKERYGLWAAVTSVFTWASLFDLGLSSGLVNLVSRAHGREDEAAAREAFATAFATLSVVALAAGLVAAAALPLVSWSSLLGAAGVVPEATVRWSVAAALGTFLLGLPLGAVPQLYAGYQRTYVVNGFMLIGTAASLAAMIAAVLGGASMPVLVVCLSSGMLVSSGLALAWIPRALPWIRLRPSGATRAALRALTRRSVPIFLFQLGALAVNEAQVIILARRSGLVTVTEYSIAFRLYALLSSLILLGTASFLPPFREAHERGDRAWALRGFRNLQVVRMALAAGGAAGLVLLGNPLLRVWLRRDDMHLGLPVWGALALLLLAGTWVSVYSDFLWIMDRIWPLVALALVNGALTVTLTWIVAPAHGVLGAVLASAVFTLGIGAWVLPLLARPALAGVGAPAPGPRPAEESSPP